ncbi:PREDICTED: MAP7 domain-containing protein 2-like isoform X3 [Nicrophorus vespilloides]|uniref:MAP7 domain-containing protein 2-like isoform X3 n=1 Tax=Nicrophorus vespilloides TaxID=110193 RepID=A0ABM1NA07_NICVS|nr:PREDICTED: MAP7 domain-containing protein 2-like isoform X3 [Nicrophorus vespilloides]
MGPQMGGRGIPSSSIEHLRSILISSLPAENIGIHDKKKSEQQRVRFASHNALAGSRPSSAAKEDREARIRTLKERQNEERQKKLEEIKAQAVAAQRHKEQKEQERRLRMEELRVREDSRRQQVEERKKAIYEAERDKLESILRRNQEREARIEAKKRNDRSSMVFAFGSSTPRMLEPTDSIGSFWGHRRATSTQNITCTAVPLTRRQSERELDGGSKKRATSAGGLERSGEDVLRMSSSMHEIFNWGSTTAISNGKKLTRSSSVHFGTPPQTPAGCVSGYVGRRRTDLMPTIPSKDSPSSGNRKPFTRSPGRAYSMSRLDQLSKPRKRPDLAPVSETSSPRPLNHTQQSSVSRSMSHIAVSKLGPPQRPLRKSDSRSMHQLSAGAAPLPPPRTTRATQLRQQKLANANASNHSEAPSRPSSSLSQQSTSSVTSSVNMRTRPVAAPRRPRPVSIAVTGVTTVNSTPEKNTKPPLPKSRKSSLVKSQEKLKRKPAASSPTDATPKNITSPTTNNPPVAQVTETKVERELIDNKVKVESESLTEQLVDLNHSEENVKSKQREVVKEPTPPPVIESTNVTTTTTTTASTVTITNNEPQKEDKKSEEETSEVVDMSASMTKVRITTEEEAKAALAERRRLAREEAERQAEMERLRIEEEARIEFERQQKEEEQQRILIEQMRAAEQERLEEAIRETQRREEEERLRKEEEHRQKLLKEEADRKAREEAERQKAELQERLKHEEKEREARRKRVEAIMLRTRGKNNSSTPPQTEERNEENNSDKLNGSKSETSENGHKNGKDIETVDNIIPVETLKNANTVNVDTLSTDDTLNSNNSWQHNTQNDLMM